MKSIRNFDESSGTSVVAQQYETGIVITVAHIDSDNKVHGLTILEEVIARDNGTVSIRKHPFGVDPDIEAQISDPYAVIIDIPK